MTMNKLKMFVIKWAEKDYISITQDIAKFINANCPNTAKIAVNKNNGDTKISINLTGKQLKFILLKIYGWIVY